VSVTSAQHHQYLHRPKAWNRGLLEEEARERLRNFDISPTRSQPESSETLLKQQNGSNDIDYLKRN
jgi:hypothetical protein